VRKKLKPKVKFLAIAPFVVFFDQLSKYIAGDIVPIICNKGIAFGIGLSGSFGIIIALTVLPLIFYLMIREKKIPSAIGLSLIFGGGVSNLVDRLMLGCVRDFINLPSWTRWPSFNLADSAISIGVLIIGYQLIHRHGKKA